MNLTDQQRKLLWICLGILATIYVVRSVVTSAMQAAYYRQQAASRNKPSPFPKVPSNATGAANLPPENTLLANLSGIWTGRTILEGRGIANLRFELRQNQPGHFSGYSTMSVVNPELFVNSKDRALNPLSALLVKGNPASAILSGAPENGAIHFRVDKTIGDNNGCALTSLTLTPFGTGQLAVEWQEGTCQGGHMIMQKERP